jgi:prepilin-type N-terminal cleavage/methylation domain-containing protein
MKRAGFTLIEILFATLILATGLFVLVTGIGNCARRMMLSKEFQDAQFVFNLGERCYPVPPNDEISDPEKDERLNVDPVSADEMIDDLEIDLPREARGVYHLFTFERSVDEKELETGEEDDGLYVLRTRISWGVGKNGNSEELVRLIRKKK